jgi:hypothetical protein
MEIITSSLNPAFAREIMSLLVSSFPVVEGCACTGVLKSPPIPVRSKDIEIKKKI